MEKSYQKHFEKTLLLPRFKARVVQADKNIKVKLSQVIMKRPNKPDIKSYQMAKSAWYFEGMFKRKLPNVTNCDNIVLAAIEFAILSLLAMIADRNSEREKDSKLLMIYFDFFLAQSSFIYLVNQQKQIQSDPNVDQKFQDYWDLLEFIRTTSQSEIEAMVLAQFDRTFNATLTGLLEKYQIKQDHALRFELLHDELCHVHKHNIRDVYDDEFKKDRKFITADYYLNQANDTVSNVKHHETPLFYWLESFDNDEYHHHYRKTYTDKRMDGHSTVIYLTSYYKTLQHP